MFKMLSLVLVLTATFAFSAFAHHPAADMVDTEIYAMIDDIVADTPHGDMVFDDEMGTTTISDITVDDADDMIQDGLLEAASVLDGEVTLTIEFLEPTTVVVQPQLLSIEELSQTKASKANQEKYQNVWERPIQIKILQKK